jgi:hypothetical protein
VPTAHEVMAQLKGIRGDLEKVRSAKKEMKQAIKKQAELSKIVDEESYIGFEEDNRAITEVEYKYRQLMKG